jgi:hypothetical protein
LYRNTIITTTTNTTMGHPTSLTEAAPAYDEHSFNHDHPVNASAPSGSTSAYATIPQNEPDIELALSGPAPGSSNPPNSFIPHQHCEACDALITAREKRAEDQQSCLWVSLVFMTISVSAMLLGVAAIVSKYKYHKD